MGRVPRRGHPARDRALPAPALSTTVPLPVAAGPLRLRTLAISHGWFQTPPFTWEPGAGVLRRVERLEGGRVVLSVGQEPDGLRATADRRLTPGETAEAARRLARVLQLGADLSGFHAALGFDPPLARDLTRIGAGRLLAGASLWEDAVKGICGTNTSWTQAVAVIGRIGAWDPDGAFPEPETVLARGEDALREQARAGYRATYLTGAARMAAEGRLAEIEAAAAGAEPAELVGRIRAIPGVGPATAVFLAFLCGRYDAGALVDSATRAVAAERWFGGRRPDDAEIRAVAAPAGRWAGLALLWATMRRWQRETGLDP